MRAAVAHVSHAYPYWNASGGTDHVFFIFGERQTCLVPADVCGSEFLKSWPLSACCAQRPAFASPFATGARQGDYHRPLG